MAKSMRERLSSDREDLGVLLEDLQVASTTTGAQGGKEAAICIVKLQEADMWLRKWIAKYPKT